MFKENIFAGEMVGNLDNSSPNSAIIWYLFMFSHIYTICDGSIVT